MKNEFTRSLRPGRLFLAALSLLVGTAGPASAVDWLAGIGGNGRLVMFPADNPSDVTVVKVTGLQKKEKLLGVDVRPATGQLYALGSTSRLYTINWETGAATAIGTLPFTPLLSGTKFAFDFNPTVDRVRIMSDSGQNFRAHPDTGAVVLVDTSLAYAVGDAGAGSIPAVASCAYTNSVTPAPLTTTLYDIDSARDTLVVQNPPNNGTLNTVGALGVDSTSVAGFDISGASGTAYASLVTKLKRGNTLRASLYTINLTTGAATPVGKIGGPYPLGSLTVIGQTAE